MTNYLLSIDPSIKNTGFTLWEKECEINCKYLWKPIETNTQHTNDIWKPIWIKSYSFEKFKNINPTFDEQIIFELFMIGEIGNFDNMNIIIERGTFHSKNGIGYETQEHLRGFIAGQFNKLLTKDMLISPSEWKKWYERYDPPIFWLRPWDKELSIYVAEEIIKENKWDIRTCLKSF